MEDLLLTEKPIGATREPELVWLKQPAAVFKW